jgi:hypothetical protein
VAPACRSRLIRSTTSSARIWGHPKNLDATVEKFMADMREQRRAGRPDAEFDTPVECRTASHPDRMPWRLPTQLVVDVAPPQIEVLRL